VNAAPVLNRLNDIPCCYGMRKRILDQMPDRCADDPESEYAHRQAFDEGRPRPVAQGHPHHEEADAVIAGIGKEIERIRLKGDGAGGQTRNDLDEEHSGIDAERHPQDAAVASILLAARGIILWAMCAAMRAHPGPFSLLFTIQDKPYSNYRVNAEEENTTDHR
jgi:hypothetical protein